MSESIQNIKNSIEVTNTETITFKDCKKLQIVTYDLLNDLSEDELYEFINFKSSLMSQNNIFTNAQLQLMIEYADGWKSTKFHTVGEQIENIYNYNDIESFDNTVLSFKIAFIIK